MVYSDAQHSASVSELARQGNLQAISYWLNSRLATYRLLARISQPKFGSLRVVVELRPHAKQKANTPAFRNRLVRYICHQLWQLNSPNLEGAIIAARYIGQSKILWKQSVRIISPARRLCLANSPDAVQRRVNQATRKRKQFQTLRSVLISGSSVAAFIFGCWLGYADAPSEQTQAVAVISQLNRGETMVQTALETVPVQQPKEISKAEDIRLMFAGDVDFSNNYDKTIGKDDHWSLGAMDDLRQSDISMVNLDTPLTNATQMQPGPSNRAKASPDHVNILKSGGIDLVNLANSDIMGYQGEGLTETIKTLKQAGITPIGAGPTATDARRPVIMEVKGQRVAYLSYYDSDLNAATDSQAGTNPRRNDRIAADIKSIRDQVNWVVVNYHWGEEMAKYPGDWQIDLARFTVDQGADLVVGHHSKVLQGAEIYKGRPIAYSLGNFIFSGQVPDQKMSDYDTAVLKVSLKDTKMRVEFLPVEVRNFQAKVVNGPRGQHILEQIQHVSDIFETPLDSPMILDTKSNTAVPIGPTESAPIIQPIQNRLQDPVEPESTLQPNREHPWNQTNFTVPSDDAAGQQGNAQLENMQPRQLELPIPDQTPPNSTNKLNDDALESSKRRYAQNRPLSQLTP